MQTIFVEEIERLDRELGIAREVQAHLLPLQLPAISGYDLAAFNRPCKELGGDYFDVFAAGDRYFVVIADVSGKGIGAALLMSNLQAMVRTLARQESDPCRFLESINADLAGRVGDGMFITMFCLVLDPRQGMACYASAGHNPPVLQRQNGEMCRLEASGVPLGILAIRGYETASFAIHPGDALVLYTDGITESTDSTGELFGEERLQQIVQQHAHVGAHSLRGAICTEVDGFRNGFPLGDDVTLVVLKRSLDHSSSETDTRPVTDTIPLSFGKFAVNLGIPSSTEEIELAEVPFRMLLLGDFSGRESRGLFEPASAFDRRNLRIVDRDNLEEVMVKLKVALALPLPGTDGLAATVAFSELDDFHPDKLFARLDLFAAIREKRRKLEAGEISPAVNHSAATSSFSGREGAAAPPIQTSASLLDDVLNVTAGSVAAEAVSGPVSEWDGYLQRIVQPYAVKNDKGRDELLAALDAATGEMMRAILHYPAFRELEAAWRGLDLLVSRLDTDENLSICLLDVTKAELSAALSSSESLDSTAVWRLLAGDSGKLSVDELLGLVCGQYTFTNCRDDVATLGRLSMIAEAVGTPFIAAASAQTVRDAEGDPAWDALRQLSSARYLGLALPRFLQRLPYGEKTSPVESFTFEEMASQPVSDQYLWGNPALLCACLLGQSFNESGWDLRLGEHQDITDLPLHVYKDGDGNPCATPSAEFVFSQSATEEIMARGFMLFLAFKDCDFLRLARCQSLANPPSLLAGRWG